MRQAFQATGEEAQSVHRLFNYSNPRCVRLRKDNSRTVRRFVRKAIADSETASAPDAE